MFINPNFELKDFVLGSPEQFLADNLREETLIRLRDLVFRDNNDLSQFYNKILQLKQSSNS